MADRPVEWDALARVPDPMEVSTIKEFIKSGYDLTKLRDCALQAGYAPDKAARAGLKAIKKIANNPKMQRALKKQGVSYDRLAKKINDLLDAEHPQFDGKPDNLAQLKAVDMALKIQDAYPSQKIDIDHTETHQIVISSEIIHSIEKAKGIKVIDVTPEPVKGYFE